MKLLSLLIILSGISSFAQSPTPIPNSFPEVSISKEVDVLTLPQVMEKVKKCAFKKEACPK